MSRYPCLAIFSTSRPFVRQSATAQAPFEYIITRASGFASLVSRTNVGDPVRSLLDDFRRRNGSPQGPSRRYGTGKPNISRSMMASNPTARDRLPH